MNSGEWNKIVGGALGAVLLFLLLGFVSEMIYVGRGEHGENRVLAFAVEVQETGSGGEAEAGPDWGTLLASADADAGASAFNKCKACHSVEDGANGVGPYLHGVVGRDIASVEGYAYSEALLSKDGAWDLENLFGFLHNPGGWASGTKMGFAGLKDDQDKVNIVAWLNQQGGAPVELVAPAGAETAAAEGDGEAVAAATGEAEEEALLDTAEGAGLEQTDERDAEEAGVESDGEPTREAEAKAAAAMEEAAESDTRAAATYSEQESGTDELAAAGTETADGGDGAVGQTGSEEEQQATAAGPAAAAGGAYAELLAQADAGEGETIFRKCKACHRIEEGAKGVGPSLYDVVGRDIASVEGYNYSDALSAKDGSWTLEHLDAFLTDPKGWAPGTKMAFAGIDDPQGRINLITYLNGIGGTPEQLGAAGAGAGAETAELSETPGAKAQAEPEEVGGPEVQTSAEVETNPPTTAAIEGTQIESAPAEEDKEAPASGSGDAGQAAAEAPASASAGAEETAAAAAAGGGAFADLLAKADAGNGEKVFRKCKACHRLEEGAKGVGPSLYDVVGRDIASVEGYKYSDALSAKEGPWTLEHLDAFLADPKGWAPGTKMTFPGLPDAQDRIDVITYLNEADGSPEPLGQ